MQPPPKYEQFFKDLVWTVVSPSYMSRNFLSRTQFACILIHTQNEEVSMSDTAELSLKETPQ